MVVFGKISAGRSGLICAVTYYAPSGREFGHSAAPPSHFSWVFQQGWRERAPPQ